MDFDEQNKNLHFFLPKTIYLYQGKFLSQETFADLNWSVFAMAEQYSPLAVANTLIDRWGGETGIEHMKLQKLLFFTYGWWLAFRPTPFMSEKPEVWRYGPVFSSVFWAFNHYKSAPIKAPEKLTPFSREPAGVPNTDTESLEFIDWIGKRYSVFSSWQLSNMTHQPGTPWQIVAARHNYNVPKHLEIDDEINREYFTSLARKEGVLTG